MPSHLRIFSPFAVPEPHNGYFKPIISWSGNLLLILSGPVIGQECYGFQASQQRDIFSYVYLRLYVVSGNPGTGKTILAASSVSELRHPIYLKDHCPSSGVTVAYFFFEAGKPQKTTRVDAVAAILTQLLHQHKSDNTILDYFTYSMSSLQREGQTKATHTEMTGILTATLQHLDNVYLVLDGIDECSEPDDLILELWQLRHLKNLRLLVFSRPNVGTLRRMVPPTQLMTITPDSMKADLNIYFERGLTHLQDQRLLPFTIDRQSLIRNLQRGASGLFLWARLMLSYLQSPVFSSSRRISIISTLDTPELLEEMYDRILLLLSGYLRHEQSFARDVFLWTAFGQQLLTPSQLHDVFERGTRTTVLERKPYSPDDLEEFKNAVVILCGSLVEFRESTFQGVVCDFIHFSAEEYFRSHCSDLAAQVGAPHGTQAFFFPPLFEVHTDLATTCLSYLIFSVPSEPLSGSLSRPVNPHKVDQTLPFLRYATLNWAIHVSVSPETLIYIDNTSLHCFRGKLMSLLHLLGRFLSAPLTLMTWTETIYTFASYTQDTFTDIFACLTKWAHMAPDILSRCRIAGHDNLPAEMGRFAEDLCEMGQRWGMTLGRCPVQIWQDATAFTASRFFRQSSAMSVEYIPNLRVQDPQISSRCLSRISKFNTQSGQCAVLTIWPSR